MNNCHTNDHLSTTEEMIKFIDTHTHLDGEEFASDIAEVVERAKASGVAKAFLPAIDLKSIDSVVAMSRKQEGFAYPMIGLHPEEVKADYQEVLAEMEKKITTSGVKFIAIGEVGLDYYWSREFEKEQLDAFEQQVKWSIKYNLPLAIHCRKAQNEMIHILRHYENDLPGGVFHCFTGNSNEAAELLSFSNFVLGIGGVLTFKKSHLPEVLPQDVPLDRIVIETDSPYMAPVPHRGERNESGFAACVLTKLAECYNTTEEHIAEMTNENVKRVFGIEV